MNFVFFVLTVCEVGERLMKLWIGLCRCMLSAYIHNVLIWNEQSCMCSRFHSSYEHLPGALPSVQARLNILNFSHMKSCCKVQTRQGQTVCLFVSAPAVCLAYRLFFHVFDACVISLSFSVFVFDLCFSKGDGNCVTISHEEKEAGVRAEEE